MTVRVKQGWLISNCHFSWASSQDTYASATMPITSVGEGPCYSPGVLLSLDWSYSALEKHHSGPVWASSWQEQDASLT